jgi:hypothetical protein
MRQPTLSGIVKRRFLYYVNAWDYSVYDVVSDIGITPGELCRVIARQDIGHLPITTFYHIAQWLRMSLANVIALAGTRPTLRDLVRLGMAVHGYILTNTESDQGRQRTVRGLHSGALHGYESFTLRFTRDQRRLPPGQVYSR